MPAYKYYPGGGSGTTEDPRLTEMMNEVPDREVFVKNTDDSMVGTGMLLLEDNTLLAPEGFATESGSINFGDLITLSEASGFLAIQNNLNGNRYRLVDHYVPKDAPSAKPGYIHMTEAENEFISQGVSSTVLNANPLVFQYTTQLTSRVNSIKFKANAPITNLRIKITAVGPNVVVKYYPTKASWVQGTGGVNLTAGDNALDFKDTPLLFQPGEVLSYEIRADNMSLLGNPSGVPYMTAMVQRGIFKYLANAEEVPTSVGQLANDSGYITSVDVPTATSELTNDSGFVTATQAATSAPVQSVNGQTGNVTISIPAAQQASDWNATSGVTQILNKPTSFTPSAHTHVISDVTGLQAALDSKATPAQASAAAPVQSVNGQVGNVSLAIPAAQIQSDWNQSNTSALDYIKNKPTIPSVNYPVVSVNGKTGAVVLTNTDVGAAATSHTHSFADITGKPTTLSGYGIADAVSQSSLTTTLNGYVNQAGARSAVSLTTTGTSGAATYNSTTGVLNIPNYAVSTGTVTSVTAGTGLSGGTITTSGTISMPNVGTAGSYNGTITTDAQGRVTGGTNRSFTSPARSLNTAFQISATQDAQVSYAVDITVAALILAGTSGRVYLEYATDSGFTTGVTTVTSAISSTGGVLNITNVNTANLSGVIPAGRYVRLRTANVAGTPTYSFQSAQEVLLG